MERGTLRLAKRLKAQLVKQKIGLVALRFMWDRKKLLGSFGAILWFPSGFDYNLK